jgi:hypothetical protein
MQQSPSATNRSLDNQEITRLLPNSKVHYHTHKRQQPVPILRQINPLQGPFHFFKVYPTIYAQVFLVVSFP